MQRDAPSSAADGVDVLILRDPRESPRKCSLVPLKGLPRLTFHTFAPDRRLRAGRRVLLHPDGDELAAGEPSHEGLLLVDSSWRRLPTLLRSIDGDLVLRRLPKLVTAYPRKSKTFEDPEAGLASVEALYAALVLLGDRRDEILATYRWAAPFLEANPWLAGAREGC